MARQPVQLPSRGGANAAGIGNRAQYLRPAKDTQNSRALASAFSQMNRAFGRIASNEQRIANQQMADELREAEEEQQLLEQRAAVAGQIDVLTGQDQSSAYANNEMALRSYSEAGMQATMSEGLVGIATEFKEQPFYGDPLRQDEAEQWIQGEIRTAIGQAPVAVVGSMLPQIQKLGANLLQDNDTAVFETAKAQTVTDMQSNLYLSLIGGDSEAFIGVAHLERENAGLDIGKVAANDSIVDAFGYALLRAANGSEAEWTKASDAATDLLRSEFMQGLNAAQQNKMRDFEREAASQFSNASRRRSEKAAADLQFEINELQKNFVDALDTNQDISGFRRAFYELDKTGKYLDEIYNPILELHNSRFDTYLPPGPANNLTSKETLYTHIHHLDVNNIQTGTPDFTLYVLDAVNKGNMTEEDANTLRDHNTNMLLEVKDNGEYKHVLKAFRGLNDALVKGMPDGFTESMAFLSDVSEFDGGSGYFRELELRFINELTENMSSYPQDAAGQRKHIDDAAYEAVRAFIETTTNDQGKDILEVLEELDGGEGKLPRALVEHPAFKRLFTDIGYFEREEKREAQIAKAAEEAAALRSQNDQALTDLFVPPLPAAEQATETPTLTPREKSLEDIDRLLSVTQSLKAEADQLAQADRAEQREQATAEAVEEREQIDFALEQARLLEQEAGVLQQAIQEDIKALDQEIALQQTAVEQARAAAAEADAVMRQLQAGLQLQNMQPAEPRSDLPTGGDVTLDALELPQELRSSGRGEPATAPPSEPVSSGRGEPATAPPSEPVSSGRGTPATAPPIEMPSQMSLLDVPETPQATAIPTATREPMGGTASQPDAAPIPDLEQPDSTASIVLDYVEKSGAKEPEEAAKAKTAFDFAKGYLGNTEKENHEVLSAFIKKVFPNDFNDVRKTAWCAGFVNAVLKAEGTEGTGKLNARSFMKWGVEATDPSEGDVVVLWRVSKDDWRGHVGFFAGYDDDGDILVLGGNQNDSVSIKSYPKERLLGFRRAE